MKTVSLRTLFLGTFIPLVLVTLLAGLVAGWVSNTVTRLYVQSKAESVIARLDGEVMGYIQPVMTNIDDFVRFGTMTDDPQVLEALTIALGADLSYVISFYYTTEDFHTGTGSGFYVGNDGWLPPDDWVPRERGWFRNALSHSGQIAYEDAYVDAMTGDLCLTVAKTVTDSSGTLRGVVAVDLLLSNLVKMASTFSVSPRSSLYLVAADGSYITHTDESQIASGNYFADSAVPYPAASYLDGSRKSFVQGGRFYAVSQISATPWFVVAEGPVSDFTGHIRRNLVLFELGFFLFSLLCSVLNIRTIQRMRSSEKDVGLQILAEVQNLAAAAKENAATGQDQSAAVREIVATMEDNTALSESISGKIQGVTSVADKTSGDVSEGVKHLEANVKQLREIAEANRQTIDGIKDLGEKIDNIWDIVTLINSVADQAKIIAFNAELEASSAGEAGKNFHIVATEIRRLADGIIDGTKEIKERIGEIQQSSDSLILASESGTEKINSGVEGANSLSERFASIRNASEVTADSANEITTIIRQQAASSEQILQTLRQVASGVESFTAATGEISKSSEKLRGIAGSFAG